MLSGTIEYHFLDLFEQAWSLMHDLYKYLDCYT